MANAYKLMELLHSFTNDSGLIHNPPYSYWLDHSDLDRAGANFTLNAHYLGALEDFTRLLEWLNQKEVSEFSKRANLLRSSLRDQFWNAEKGLFADALLDEGLSIKYSEHANGMALALKIADENQGKSIVKQILADDPNRFIKRSTGMTIVTPALSYFLHKGLAHYGHVDASFDLFRQRFDHMLKPQYNGTLWEEWWLDGSGRSGKFDGRYTRSDAQTESAFFPALSAEFLLGIQPSKPGMVEMIIEKPNTQIQKIESIIPTPLGDLFVKWDLDSQQKRILQLVIPQGMEIKLRMSSFDIPKGKPLQINGKPVLLKGNQKSFYPLPSGKWEGVF